jgi:cytoplasmic iron level regulating protein YaaA (DUF328/UPF0246 family)
MLIVLSPAKSLDLETPPTTKLHTQPSFLDHSEQLIHRLREFSPAELGELMDLSDNLSALNVARYASWTKDTSEARQAVMTFNGDVYDGLDARTLKPAQLDYAQSRIRILSGLYGMLRPLDLIHPHRLEMGTRLNTARGKNLYDFWGDTITKALNQTAQEQGAETLVNLASEEYFKSVKPKRWLAGDYAAVRGLEERQVQNHLVLRQARTRPDGALRGRQRHHRSARS